MTTRTTTAGCSRSISPTSKSSTSSWTWTSTRSTSAKSAERLRKSVRRAPSVFGGGGVGDGSGPRTKAIDDLAVTHQAELSSRESLERSIGTTQSEDRLPKLVVLAEQAIGLLAELASLGGEAPEVQQAAGSEDARAEQYGE